MNFLPRPPFNTTRSLALQGRTDEFSTPTTPLLTQLLLLKDPRPTHPRIPAHPRKYLAFFTASSPIRRTQIRHSPASQVEEVLKSFIGPGSSVPRGSSERGASATAARDPGRSPWGASGTSRIVSESSASRALPWRTSASRRVRDRHSWYALVE